MTGAPAEMVVPETRTAEGERIVIFWPERVIVCGGAKGMAFGEVENGEMIMGPRAGDGLLLLFGWGVEGSWFGSMLLFD